MSFHAHWSSESRDCDGRYSRSGLYRQHDQREWEDELDLLDRLVVWAYKLPDYDNSTLDIRTMTDGHYALSSSRQTDEGWETLNVEMCSDDCDLGEKPSFRDHTAEAAGY